MRAFIRGEARRAATCLIEEMSVWSFSLLFPLLLSIFENFHKKRVKVPPVRTLCFPRRVQQVENRWGVSGETRSVGAGPDGFGVVLGACRRRSWAGGRRGWSRASGKGLALGNGEVWDVAVGVMA